MSKTNHSIDFETLVMNSHRESFKGNLKYNVIFHLLYIHNIEQHKKSSIRIFHKYNLQQNIIMKHVAFK